MLSRRDLCCGGVASAFALAIPKRILAAEPPRRLSWRVGDVRVTRFADFESNPPSDPAKSYPGVGAKEVRRLRWLQPGFADQRGWIRSCFCAFLLETSGRRILVDSLAGPRPPGAAPAPSTLMQDLIDAGFPLATIDTVVNTHLHFDHVGYNTVPDVDGRFGPTFPRARYLIAKPEFEYWRDQTSKPEWMRDVFERSVLPLSTTGVMEQVEADHRIAPGIDLIPTPGHTPGHVSILIASRGREAIISGDVVHHPFELAHPDREIASDHEPGLAARTRVSLLERASSTGALLLGSHFVAPGGGHVFRDGRGFRLAA